LPNVIAKDGWPVNPTDLNAIENIWSITDKTTYRDPAPKTMKKLKRVTRLCMEKCDSLHAIKELAHYMPTL